MKYLKIKDNVDLKELEKFGFVKVKKGKTGFTSIVKYWYTECDSEYDCLTVFKDRRLYLGSDISGDSYVLVKIYDLIKADMVEAVEGDE